MLDENSSEDSEDINDHDEGDGDVILNGKFSVPVLLPW